MHDRADLPESIVLGVTSPAWGFAYSVVCESSPGGGLLESRQPPDGAMRSFSVTLALERGSNT